jgi:hypothetical protein
MRGGEFGPMTATVAFGRTTSDERLHRVASFETAYAAELAADHLAEHGFRREHVGIVPADLRPVEGWWERTRRRPRLVVPMAMGVIALGSLAAVLSLTSGLALGWTLVALVGVSALIGVMAGWLDEMLADRTRRRARAERRVEAGRFDVVCTEARDRAAHVLARWWDPAARPVSVDPRPAVERSRTSGDPSRAAAA